MTPAHKSKITRLLRKATLSLTLAFTAACGGYNRFEDIHATPTACASNSRPDEMRRRIPQLAADFERMHKMPFSDSLYVVLADTSNKITSCIFNAREKREIIQSYNSEERRILVSENAGTTTTSHESYHAGQDLELPLSHKWWFLTQRDAAVGHLLTEATALAYELAARKEAANHQMPFNDQHSMISTINPWDEGKHLSDNNGVRSAFDDAYKKAWKDNAALDARTREARSLSAGGQAVVRHLLSGKHAKWNNLIKDATTLNIINAIASSYLSNDGRELYSEYTNLRNTIYSAYGTVVPEINLLPPEFLGPDAQRHIDAAFKNIGLQEIEIRDNADTAQAPSPANKM